MASELIKKRRNAMKASPEKHDYSKDYFTTTALQSGTFTIKLVARVTTTLYQSISYSLDNGETWTTTNNENSLVTVTTPTVQAGNKVLWKGIGQTMSAYQDSGSGGGSNFSATCTFDVSGNIMSLLYGDDFADKTTFASGSSSQFNEFFMNCSKLVNAKDLILPVLRLPQHAYRWMFVRCTSLITPPKLPALNVGYRAYHSLFYGCTSLERAPILPATTIDYYGYGSMFQNCTKLKYIMCLYPGDLTTYRSQLQSWLAGAYAYGTIVKHPNATYSVGNNGIPSGWTVETIK